MEMTCVSMIDLLSLSDVDETSTHEGVEFEEWN